MYRNLWEYVAALERAGELVRVAAEVDPVLEIAELTDRESKRPGGGRALLFERTGTSFPVLTNMMGSDRRIALALGVESLDDLTRRIESLFSELTAPKTSLSDKLRMLPLLERTPVIPAVKDDTALTRAAGCESRVLFLLGGDLLTIPGWIARTHEAGKQAVVHIDLVNGLAPKEVAVDWLLHQGADGILSTRPHLIRRGRELGMLTVLRVFAIDSKAVGNLQKETEMVTPDVIEILPGTLPKVIEKLSRRLPIPLIAGGLMAEKEDILAALAAGALCVSSSEDSLWEV